MKRFTKGDEAMNGSAPTASRSLFSITIGVVVVHTLVLVAAEPQRAVVVTSPTHFAASSTKPRVFLAGSIEMGKAADWQQELIREILDMDVEILNPRRQDWNPTWKPELSDSHFKEQVEWELNALAASDVIVMYFAPGTQSPISLLELGLYAQSGRLIVYCPEGFWRKGNVDAVLTRYGVEQVASLPELARAARRKLTLRLMKHP